MEVPTSLARLVRTVMRGFYTIEHSLLMDLLIRKPCAKEEELESLLRFERKQLRTLIAQLKNDKMLKARLRMETGPDGKATRQNYHYINYKAFVNVVKYKLDHMRRKIETEERDSTSRASFVCTECKKAYTDLEADQLCDLTTGEFKCCNCGALVEEDPNVMPKTDSRLVLARFNEQMEPLYILLKEVEDIVLPSDILEPEPSDSNNLPGSRNDNRTTAVHIESGGDLWRQRRTDYDGMQVDTSLTIKLESDDMAANGAIGPPNGNISSDGRRGAVKKEQPAWLTNSTVDYESNPLVNGSDQSSQMPLVSSPFSRRGSEYDRSNGFTSNALSDAANSALMSSEISKEILETLKQHERESSDSFSEALSLIRSNHVLDQSNPFAHQNGDIQSPEDVDADGDVLMESDEECEQEGPFVRVHGQLLQLRDVDESVVQQMTPSELDEYIRLARDLHSHLYD